MNVTSNSTQPIKTIAIRRHLIKKTKLRSLFSFLNTECIHSSSPW